MCQKCADLVAKYLPNVWYSGRGVRFLISHTCFPFGEPEQLEPQLKAASERYYRRHKKHRQGWLRKEGILMDREDELALASVRNQPDSFWDQ